MAFVQRPKDAPIYDLQTLLRTVQPEQELNRDGIYGSETRDAVIAFQQKTGLPATGVADRETWDALKLAFSEQEIHRGPAEPLLIILQPGQVIRRGERNLHLYLIQGMLLALGQLDPEFPNFNPSGTLDADTALALLKFQRISGLEETGELDKNTWRHLAKQYRLMIGDGTGRFPLRRTQKVEE